MQWEDTNELETSLYLLHRVYLAHDPGIIFHLIPWCQATIRFSDKEISEI